MSDAITLQVGRRGAPASEFDVALAGEFCNALKADIEAMPLNALGEVIGQLAADYALKAFPGLSLNQGLEDVAGRALRRIDLDFLRYAQRVRHAVRANDMREEFERAVRAALGS
jgi:hypothetical protein